jgi:hypothetical protein
MKPEQQRIAIAEACGWQADGPWANYWTHKRGPAGVSIPTESLPNYPGDLNAIHEAEKVLTVGQRITYAHQIGVVLSGGSVGRAIPNWWFIHEATAAQRAEAFLRTLNL